MFSKADNSQPELSIPSPRHRKRLYAFGGIVAVIVIASALFAPQAIGVSLELGLNYTVGEKMTYLSTNTVTNQMSNTSINVETNPLTQTYNSTGVYEILGFDGETYTIKLTITSELNGQALSIPITTNTSKAQYYNNLLPAGSPAFFLNASGNPTLQAYLSKSQVKVGGTWQFPVSTGNASLGLTGEITLKFSGIQETTVPAGTYKVFVVDLSSSNLIMHISPDNGVISASTLDNSILQLNGRTYLEVGTCRLIKSELTQETTVQQPGISGTSTIYSEKTLTEHTKP
ncbi:hypothetical protein IMZ68_05015 [Candidatus Bathyarchaeota archaeon]|nr:hypothetical protein [Candidatus Bathyarchaeota archaeon]